MRTASRGLTSEAGPAKHITAIRLLRQRTTRQALIRPYFGGLTLTLAIVKPQTRARLQAQGIDPDSTIGRIVADMIEEQETYLRKRDQEARERDPDDGRDIPPSFPILRARFLADRTPEVIAEQLDITADEYQRRYDAELAEFKAWATTNRRRAEQPPRPPGA